MVTRRPRIAFICNQDTKEFLEDWANDENRTLSNLIETIVEEAVAAKKQQNEPPTSGTGSSGKGRGEGRG
jgi:hypothetical protein